MDGYIETIGLGICSLILATASSDQLDNESVRQFAYAVGFSGVGASAGALSAAWMTKNLNAVEMRQRFKINILVGIPLGIGGGYTLHHFCDYVPIFASLIAAAAVSGWCGVKLLVTWIPKLVGRYLNAKPDR